MDSSHNVHHSSENKSNKKLFGVLSYLGPLVIIPLLVDKEDPFVKFHVKQGLVLFCLEIVLSILLKGMLWVFWPIYQLIHLAIVVLAIIGIINVVKGREKELPIVGGLARYFSKI